MTGRAKIGSSDATVTNVSSGEVIRPSKFDQYHYYCLSFGLITALVGSGFVAILRCSIITITAAKNFDSSPGMFNYLLGSFAHFERNHCSIGGRFSYDLVS